ncbi:GNAT family N-acetyltransferase [Microterricola viridarii]|uniref:N-acetyltransferase domain-containing protein n=1 Tax=Microterricola viridarii TaxID=412690 RepID=A0A109QYT1_9MICO|nr:GNAT family N-acetyltransferase [Microterricola viridarii]AMB58965.1 hypothetical protein AWU67_08940 [Microterricola viridarii]
MVQFVETDVTSAAAQELLGEYFAERAVGFPPEQGAYQPTFPLPEHFTAPAGQFLLVVDAADEVGGGELLGCGGIRRIQRADAGLVRFEVKHLYLRQGTRGRGLGRALLTELERRAEQLGAEEIVLDTNASLESAGQLYRRAGYADIAAYNANPNATNWYGKRVG